MNGKKDSRRFLDFGWALRHLALLLFDVVVVNFAYYVALIIRFWVGGDFHPVAVNKYLPAFYKFAPYYTLICVVVFLLFRLYNSHWVQAGLYDLNRILAANVITALIQIAGTVLVVQRMPITYYGIGAVIQLLLIAASRFAYRFLLLESKTFRRLGRKKMNAMIVGAGDTAMILRNQIEMDSDSMVRPVCVFSGIKVAAGTMINGLPLLTDADKLGEQMDKYRVRCVLLADPDISAEIRSRLCALCEEKAVEVQDFSGYLAGSGATITLKKLLEYASGGVDIILDGKTESFPSGEAAMMAYRDMYEVKKLGASDGRITVEIIRKSIVLNNTSEDWVKDIEDESGREISFF